MTKTFLDSGVLLAAWRGIEIADAALAVIESENREFYTSQIVKLELLPKPTYHKQKSELEFYHEHFDSVKAEEPLTPELAEEAFQLASKYGIAAIDALHLAAAIRQGVHEFITTEKPGKPIFRVSSIMVKSLHTLSSREW